MPDRKSWSSAASVVGAVGLVIGSFDPMEGSALILPATGLLALGSYMRSESPRLIAYRTFGFVLVLIGVVALFGLSAIGGIGGSSGRSTWWALLILPYFAGWSIDIWGPGLPRWLSVAGIAIAMWYLAIGGMLLQRSANPAQMRSIVPAVLIGVIGIATIVACVVRLSKGPASI